MSFSSNEIWKTYEKIALKYDIINDPMDKFMFAKGRHIFSKLHGDILEIGIGTGINLPFYSRDSRVVGLEWSGMMIKLSQHRIIKEHLVHVKSIIQGDVQQLTKYFKPKSFDYVTSTCVFCSVPDPIRGYHEITKVLRPNGLLVQLEHGISKIYPLKLLMKMIDPLTAKTRGFHLARDQIRNLQSANFEIIKTSELDPMGIARIIISHPK